MVKNHEEINSDNPTNWSNFTQNAQKEVPFKGNTTPTNPHTLTPKQLYKQGKAETLGRMRAEVLGTFRAKELSQETKSIPTPTLSNADKEHLAELDAERSKSETAHQEEEKSRWNIDNYGSNIPAATARNAFNKEYHHLRLKIEREKRTIEKEREMPPEKRSKSQRKREKHGETVSPEERKHFQELSYIYNLNDNSAKESYGRSKEQIFRKIQDSMNANKRQFKKILKEHKLFIPETWDDANYSLDNLRRIEHLTAFLRQK